MWSTITAKISDFSYFLFINMVAGATYVAPAAVYRFDKGRGCASLNSSAAILAGRPM